MKNKTLTQKFRENPFIPATLVLGIFCLILICGMYFNQVETFESKPQSPTAKEYYCKVATAFPSWADNHGNIISTGYQTFGDERFNFVEDELIPKKIFFIYHSGCKFCHKQIEYFGKTWEDYVNSGLTIDCLK